MGGADKASLDLDGRSLLQRAVDTVRGVTPAPTSVVVVGPRRKLTATEEVVEAPAGEVVFVTEDPPRGGPAAGLLAGVDAVGDAVSAFAVLAVDMPGVSSSTLSRLRTAGSAADGAILVDADGRRQLAAFLDRAALHRVRPTDSTHGLPLHRLLRGLDLVEVAATAIESRDIDTWGDLRRAARVHESGGVNLHDWIDELCDSLDVELELDEGLVLDLARVAAHNVARPAAPITTFLVGYAAGSRGAGVEEQEQLAARAQRLAENWDRPADAPDPDDVEDVIPDDSTVDHTGDAFE